MDLSQVILVDLNRTFRLYGNAQEMAECMLNIKINANRKSNKPRFETKRIPFIFATSAIQPKHTYNKLVNLQWKSLSGSTDSSSTSNSKLLQWYNYR